MFAAAGLGGSGGTSMSPFLNARRETVKSCKNAYDFSSYCGFATHPTLPLGETNLCFFAPSLV